MSHLPFVQQRRRLIVSKRHGVCGVAAVTAAVLLAGSAQAIPCGAGQIDSRFTEAALLCSGAARATAIETTPAALPSAVSSSIETRVPVSVTMSVPTQRLQRAAEAVRLSGRAPTDALIIEMGRRYRIDPYLLASIVRAESGGRADAISNKGALGLMQVMPATARGLGVTDPRRLLTDRVLAIDTGARYLKSLQARFGNRPDLVLAAYNAGPGAVEKAGMKIPAYRETQGYVGSILRHYRATRPKRAKPAR